MSRFFGIAKALLGLSRGAPPAAASAAATADAGESKQPDPESDYVTVSASPSSPSAPASAQAAPASPAASPLTPAPAPAPAPSVSVASITPAVAAEETQAEAAQAEVEAEPAPAPAPSPQTVISAPAMITPTQEPSPAATHGDSKQEEPQGLSASTAAAAAAALPPAAAAPALKAAGAEAFVKGASVPSDEKGEKQEKEQEEEPAVQKEGEPEPETTDSASAKVEYPATFAPEVLPSRAPSFDRFGGLSVDTRPSSLKGKLRFFTEEDLFQKPKAKVTFTFAPLLPSPIEKALQQTREALAASQQHQVKATKDLTARLEAKDKELFEERTKLAQLQADVKQLSGVRDQLQQRLAVANSQVQAQSSKLNELEAKLAAECVKAREAQKVSAQKLLEQKRAAERDLEDVRKSQDTLMQQLEECKKELAEAKEVTTLLLQRADEEDNERKGLEEVQKLLVAQVESVRAEYKEERKAREATEGKLAEAVTAVEDEKTARADAESKLAEATAYIEEEKKRVECCICGDEFHPRDTFSCDGKVPHALCSTTCLVQAVSTAVGSPEKCHMKCPMCQEEWNMKKLLDTLPEAIGNKVEQRMLSDLQAAIPTVRCPSCPFFVETEPLALFQRGYIWDCLGCGKVYCMACDPPEHLADDMNAFGEQVAEGKGVHECKVERKRRKEVEDLLTACSVAECPRCKSAILKPNLRECNAVKCTNCALYLCYLCDRQTSNIVGFKENTAQSAQAGVEAHQAHPHASQYDAKLQCGLWDHNISVHRNAKLLVRMPEYFASLPREERATVWGAHQEQIQQNIDDPATRAELERRVLATFDA